MQKTHIGGKQQLPKNRPLQEKASYDGKGNIPDAKLYERSVKRRIGDKRSRIGMDFKKVVKSTEIGGSQ